MNEKFIEENYDTQNTKNEQQKDLCITSEQRTEQLEKGELPNGYYWIRLSWGGMIIMAYYTGFDGLFELDDHYYDSDEISEVLAPVPSYDEWQASYNCMLENEVLRLKNAQLKELLEECIPYFNALVEKRLKLEYIPQVYELLSKINEVLR